MCNILFYLKEGCHLCDTMERELHRFINDHKAQATINVEIRDIEEHSEWYERYREYVPVLLVNDIEVCHYFIDRDELKIACCI